MVKDKFFLRIKKAVDCLLKGFNNIFFSFFPLLLQWGQNLTLMYDRVLRYPERVGNLYFTFLFVLRAVTKVSINRVKSQIRHEVIY